MTLYGGCVSGGRVEGCRRVDSSRWSLSGAGARGRLRRGGPVPPETSA